MAAYGEARKYTIFEEAEGRAKLTIHDYNYLPGENNSVVIYVMSFIRDQSLGKAYQCS